MCFNYRRLKLLAGHNAKLCLFDVNGTDDLQFSTDVLEREWFTCTDHSDVVRCLVAGEGRFYSGGFGACFKHGVDLIVSSRRYDRKLNIYEMPYHGNVKLRPVHTVHNAHEAAITCLVYGKDAENSWLISGSFDRTVKLWSMDGSLLQKFDGFSYDFRLCAHN